MRLWRKTKAEGHHTPGVAMRLTPAAAILAAALLAGCGTAPTPGTSSPPDGEVTILRSPHCDPGYDPERAGEARLVLRSDAAWKEAWDKRCAAGRFPYQEPPPVDFTSEMALLYAWGEKPSGGHAAAIEAVEMSNGTLLVHVHRVAPSPDCPAPAIIQYPGAIAVVTRLPEVPVTWLFRDETRTCEG
jgi:hypothetical protein